MDAVVFDLFGTLIPNLTWASFDRASRDVARLLGAPLPGLLSELEAQFPRRMTGEIPDGPDQFRPLCDALGIDPPRARLHAAAARWHAWLASGMVPKHDAVATLTALRERGVRLALASDCSSSTPDLLAATPLDPFFEVCAFSARIGQQKPHAEMYRHVLGGLGVPGERCLFVGDGNSSELPGAKAHGMTTVWVDNGSEQHWQVNFAPGGDHAVRELGEVVALVDRFLS